MFSISKGEPPTPPSTTVNPSTAEIEITPREQPQNQKMEAITRSLSAPVESKSTSTNQPATEIGIAGRQLPLIRTQSAPFESDSGFEASPSSLNDPVCSNFPFFPDDNDVGFDDVFEDDASSILLERVDAASSILLERVDDDDDCCPNCNEVSSCSCSRAESSATVRAAMTSYTDPNTCDSDSSNRSSSPQSPPPSSWPIPASCNHIHNDRLPCPRCSGRESLQTPTSSMSYLHDMVASRSYPGSYPASLLHWWNQSSPSASVFSPRVAAALSRTSNRSDDRRSSRRRQIDSDASSISSLSCDEHSDDELFPTSCEGGAYLDDLGTMAEPEELRVDSPEHLALPSESSSRRARSQSVSIPLDHDYLREIGISLRRLSNDFENRLAERNRQRRRSSLAQYFYW
ncbi:uncharacterized protein LOC129957400 [Argiope bruennichi]|uniref:uncharacterized protein LOC129957400 n=1 Tax=Argiope bruennichi TaxID=94029 RepID=UPI0024950B5D|nr:uncharacterized protein LOC129957400 [Argiope bruennichi]